MVRRVAFLGLVLASACAHPHPAPLRPHRAVRAGVIRPWAMAILEAGWDTAQDAHERAYCVMQGYALAEPPEARIDSLYVVWSVIPAPTDSAGPSWIEYRCPASAPSIHTHPAHGNPPMCDPSIPDREALERSKAPFHVIQCGPDYFRFYYPDGT